METSFPSLPPEIEAAVAAQHGGPVAVPGQQGEHVVMSMAIFRDMMGVGDDAEFAKSVAVIKSSLDQAAVGQTISLEDARQRLTGKYGVIAAPSLPAARIANAVRRLGGGR